MRARKREGSRLLAPASVLTAALLVISAWTFALGAETKKDLPERYISLAPEYTGIVLQSGSDVSMDLTVKNGGKKDENVNLLVTSVPEGWKAWFKTYSFGITGVHVESDKSKNLTLRVEPAENVEVGQYSIGLKAVTEDGALSSTGKVTITVEKKATEKKVGGVNIITSYPVLRGPTDGKFEFSLEVENKLDKDGIFNLTAQGPENWDINFKPAYEDKFISSLRLKANQSQTVAVEVKPFPYADPGQYPIQVKVSSPEAKGEALLNVVLTGTYKLDVGTATGLLSLEAMRGKGANISFFVKNTGSAPLTNVQFLSFKPENWKVEFNPDKIDSLPPDKLKQVEVTITPSEQALVGDYSVGLSVEAGKASKTLEFRTTVKAATAWGWIGIGIIVLVMAGLVVLFIRLGRR
jgi:uncharacterized membrane protein